MTAPTSVTSALLGQQISFSSKNPIDATEYTGIVTGLVTPQLAPQFGLDLVAYNAAVQRFDSTVGAISTLTFFIVALSVTQTGNPITQVFANQWISPGSLVVANQPNVYTVEVYDTPSNGVAAILGLLRSNGYSATQITSS